MPRIWLIAVWFLVSTPAWTQETAWYDIELVVFENTDPAAGLTETWPDDPGFPELEGAKELIPPGAEPVAAPDLETPGAELPALHGLDAADTPDSTALAPEQSPTAHEELQPAVDAMPPLDLWVPFLLRPASDLKLSDAVRRLNRSGRFRVITHAAWRQALSRGGPTAPVHIHNMLGDIETYQRLSQSALEHGLPLAPNVATFEMTPPATVSESSDGSVVAEIEAATTGAFPTPVQRPIEFPLDGTVTIRLARYLHIDADLIWHRMEQAREDAQPGPPIEITMDGSPITPEVRMRGYRLNESRRMRSKELHYLDHPVYGVLALITPVDEAAKQAEQPEDGSNP